jgi:hypothetical protein
MAFQSIVVAVVLVAGGFQDAGSELRDRQAEMNRILRDEPMSDVRGGRMNCAIGATGRWEQAFRNTHPGLIEGYKAADICFAYLTRLARSGSLAPVENPNVSPDLPSMIFDRGVVTGFAKGEAIPAGLPTMGELKETAEHCLSGTERDGELCLAAGYAVGTRIAAGEVVTAG